MTYDVVTGLANGTTRRKKKKRPLVDGLTRPSIRIAAQSCTVPNGLSFCTQIDFPAYLPPGETFSSLDAISATYYGAFTSSLSQFNCDSIRYSPVRNCTDCARAYHDWVRSFMCEDADTRS